MAAAPAPTGATIDVNMELVGSTYKYDPATHHRQGRRRDQVPQQERRSAQRRVRCGRHSLRLGGAIDAALGATKMGPLTGALLVEPDAVFTFSTAGFPAGTYNFHCTPHQALGMKGVLTVN